MICSVTGCHRPHYARDLCEMHYERNRRADPVVRLRQHKNNAIRNRKRRANDPAYVQREREYTRAYSSGHRRARNLALKLETLEHYGGARCVQCGCTDVDQLDLDHVNGDGREHRRALLLGSPRRGGAACSLPRQPQHSAQARE